MKFKEFKDRKNTDLEKLASEKKETLRVIRSNISGSKTRNVKEMHNIKKDIARILTAMNQNKTVKK